MTANVRDQKYAVQKHEHTNTSLRVMLITPWLQQLITNQKRNTT